MAEQQQTVVEDQFTRPQGLYPKREVDLEELRRLILDAKLAPCHAGSDELNDELDECPICFLGYPSINWLRCCRKGVCTECFIVMKIPSTTSIEWCPFCIKAGTSVEYRGQRTAEERMKDMEEDQKLIEAEIRKRRGKEAAPASALPSGNQDQKAHEVIDLEDDMHVDTHAFAASLTTEEEQRAIEEEIRRIQEQEAYAASLADLEEQRMIEADIQMRQGEEAYSVLVAGQVASLDAPAIASAAAASAPTTSSSASASASVSSSVPSSSILPSSAAASDGQGSVSAAGHAAAAAPAAVGSSAAGGALAAEGRGGDDSGGGGGNGCSESPPASASEAGMEVSTSRAGGDVDAAVLPATPATVQA